MAAGLSLREDVAVFRGKINACCELTEEDFIPKIRIDMAMPAAYPTIGLIRELARLEPFGNGNSKPQFADRELALLRASVVGRNQNVLKLSLMTAAGEHVSRSILGMWRHGSSITAKNTGRRRWTLRFAEGRMPSGCR